jgi:hypothetical protein
MCTRLANVDFTIFTAGSCKVPTRLKAGAYDSDDTTRIVESVNAMVYVFTCYLVVCGRLDAVRDEASSAQRLLERGAGPEEQRQAAAELLAAVAEAREAWEARVRGLGALEAGEGVRIGEEIWQIMLRGKASGSRS